MRWFGVSLAELILALMLALGGSDYVSAEPIQWGGNGHYYEVISAPGGITWDDANAAATAAEGYLATITSQQENDFVFGLVDFPQFWDDPIIGNRGPWLGGFQSPPTTDPSANWQWVTGEPWSYTNWASLQPNDFQGEVEDKLHFVEPSAGGTRSPTWNDIRNFDPGGRPIAYVLESVPEPSTFVLLAGGIFMLLAYAFHRRRKVT